jgi:hypothetical protein
MKETKTLKTWHTGDEDEIVNIRFPLERFRKTEKLHQKWSKK